MNTLDGMFDPLLAMDGIDESLKKSCAGAREHGRGFDPLLAMDRLDARMGPAYGGAGWSDPEAPC